MSPFMLLINTKWQRVPSKKRVSMLCNSATYLVTLGWPKGDPHRRAPPRRKAGAPRRPPGGWRPPSGALPRHGGAAGRTGATRSAGSGWLHPSPCSPGPSVCPPGRRAPGSLQAMLERQTVTDHILIDCNIVSLVCVCFVSIFSFFIFTF